MRVILAVLAAASVTAATGWWHTPGVSPAGSTAPLTPQVFPPLGGWFSSQQGAFVGSRTSTVEAVTATSVERVAPLGYAAFAGMRRGQVVIWVSTRWKTPVRAIATATSAAFSLRRAQAVHHPCVFPGHPCLPGVRYSWVPYPRLTASHPFLSIDAYVPSRRPGPHLQRDIQARVHQLLVVNLR